MPPYTLNMCSAKPETREFARMAFKEDLLRLEELPCQLYNFHPGSHTGQGESKRALLELSDSQRRNVGRSENHSGAGNDVW